MSPASNGSPTPEDPGSVSGAPDLPAGFAETFTRRYVDTGDVRLHVVTGGDGPPLLLVLGWPETWSACRFVMSTVAHGLTCVARDQRGIGLSDKSAHGYVSVTVANYIVAYMHSLGHERSVLYWTDT